MHPTEDRAADPAQPSSPAAPPVTHHFTAELPRIDRPRDEQLMQGTNRQTALHVIQTLYPNGMGRYQTSEHILFALRDELPRADMDAITASEVAIAARKLELSGWEWREVRFNLTDTADVNAFQRLLRCAKECDNWNMQSTAA